jgi:hypothetical protein
MSSSMTREEAIRLLLRYGVAPEDAMAARLMDAADRMAASLAALPQDLPAGLEPASAFAVPRP